MDDQEDIHKKKELIGDNYKKPVRGSGDEGFEKGLNEMMKDLYQNGDGDMKRMIAERED